MITWFLSVMICWAACLALYAGLFRREKFFLLNRIYLLFTFVLGLLIPAVNWFPASAAPAGAFMEIANWLPEISISGRQAAPQTAVQGLNFSLIIIGAYLVGCLWMFVRLMRHLSRVISLVWSGKRTRHPGYTLVESPQVSAPFSFFGYLFWDSGHDYDPEEIHAVRAHEFAHIRHGHSLDLLLLEVAGLFFWWCPFWYAYNRALRNVHEYQADAAAVRRIPTRNYGQLLIRQCLSQPAPALAHGLRHHSQLKNRIAMMTKIRSSRMALAKYFTLLPLLALLSIACAKPEPGDVAGAGLTTVTDTIYTQVEQMPVFGSCPGLEGEELMDCSFHNLQQYLVSNMKYPDAAKKAGTQGMVLASFVVSEKGQVENVKIKQSLSAECDAEAIRLIGLMPNWQPGMQDGKTVKVEFVLPFKFMLGDKK